MHAAMFDSLARAGHEIPRNCIRAVRVHPGRVPRVRPRPAPGKAMPFFAAGLGKRQATIREIESRQAVFAADGDLLVMPVQPACIHQVQNQPVVLLETDNNAFTNTTDLVYSLSVSSRERRIEAANKEWFTDTNTVNDLPANALIDLFDVEIDIGEFGHGITGTVYLITERSLLPDQEDFAIRLSKLSP